MASIFLRQWTAVLSNSLQSLKFLPHRGRRERAAELQELADLLSHIERQMGRARIEYRSQALTLQQFQSLWQHKLEEIRLLLCRATLPCRLPPSLLAERVLRTLHSWEQEVHVACLRSLQAADLRALQHRLEDLADALTIYAKAEDEPWCDTQPML